MNLVEKTLKTTNVYNGEIINVQRNIVQLPSGGNTIREVVLHNGAVAIIPVIDEDNILLVKQFRYPTDKILLELPAGTLNKSENPKSCAKRELEEETGFQAKKFIQILETFVAPGYSDEIMYTFVATDLYKTQKNLDYDENIEVIKIKVKEVMKLILDGKITDAKTICGILIAKNKKLIL